MPIVSSHRRHTCHLTIPASNKFIFVCQLSAVNVSNENWTDATMKYDDDNDDDGYSEFDIIQMTVRMPVTLTVVLMLSNGAEWQKSSRLGSSECKWYDTLVASVCQVLHLVDAHQPVLRSVCFFQHVKLEIFVSDLCVTHPVVSSRLSCASNTSSNKYQEKHSTICSFINVPWQHPICQFRYNSQHVRM